MRNPPLAEIITAIGLVLIWIIGAAAFESLPGGLLHV